MSCGQAAYLDGPLLLLVVVGVVVLGVAFVCWIGTVVVDLLSMRGVASHGNPDRFPNFHGLVVDTC